MPKNKTWAKQKQQNEKQFWAVETGRFRVRNPELFAEIRARERMAKTLLRPLNKSKESKGQSIENWRGIENYLFSGKAKPKKLLEMFLKAQKSSKKMLEDKENFLKMRAAANKKLFNKNDWNAIQRVLAMKELKAAINSEIMFFGRMAEFGKAGKLAQFCELLTRLKISNDKKYAMHRQSVVLAGMGIEKQNIRTSKRIKKLANMYAEEKISAVKYLKQSLLAEYAITQQYFNLIESAEKMYAYIGRQTNDKSLKKILDRIKREIHRRKLFYMSEKTRIEMEFKKKK